MLCFRPPAAFRQCLIICFLQNGFAPGVLRLTLVLQLTVCLAKPSVLHSFSNYRKAISNFHKNSGIELTERAQTSDFVGKGIFTGKVKKI